MEPVNELLKSVSWRKVAVVVIAAAVTITAGMWILRGVGPLEGNHALVVLDHHADGCTIYLRFDVGDVHTGNAGIEFTSDQFLEICSAKRRVGGVDFEGRHGITDSIEKLTKGKNEPD